jgi:hypothetical protein
MFYNILFMFVSFCIFVVNFVYFVILYCFLLCCVLFLLLCRLFPIFVQVYGPLPPGGNPVVNIIYHVISYLIISYRNCVYSNK